MTHVGNEDSKLILMRILCCGAAPGFGHIQLIPTKKWTRHLHSEKGLPIGLLQEIDCYLDINTLSKLFEMD